MKKIVNNISFLTTTLMAALFSMTSCTLDMEDWVQTEEEKGYGELATEEYDGYKCEYEFKEETLHLTSTILEYLAYTDGDTTFYFMDNLPEEYRPKVGGYVASFCCDELPLGVNAKVVSVTHTGGMYVVETKPVELEETYKQFKLDMDMDLRFTHADDTAATRSRHKTRAMRRTAKSDLGYDVDWATYDYMVNGGKQTRGTGSSDSDFDHKENVDDEGDTEKEKEKTNEVAVVEADIDVNEICDEFIDLTSSQKSLLKGLKVTIGLYTEEKIHVIKKIDVARKYEYTKTITTKGYRIKSSVSKGFDIIALITKSPGIQKVFEKILKEHVKVASLASAFEDGAYVKPIVLGVLPCVIRIKPDISFTPAIIGNVDIWLWSGKTCTETEVVDNEVVKDEDPTLMEAPDNEYSVNAVVNASLTGSIEFFLGVGTLVPPKSVVGIGVSVSATCGVSYVQSMNISGSDAIASASDGLSFSAAIDVGGKAIAGKWVDWKFANAHFPIWNNQAIQYYPTLKYTSPTIDYKRGDNNKLYRVISYKYRFKDKGGISDTWFNMCTPEVYVKQGDKEEYYEAVNTEDCVKEGKDYQFKFYSYDNENPIELYPFLRSYKSNYPNLAFTDKKETLPDVKRPQVDYYLTQAEWHLLKNEYKVVHQTGKPLATSATDKNTGEVLDAYEFTFEMAFKLENASNISTFWKDWGYYYQVRITDDNDKRRTLDPVYISLKDKIKRNGKYEIEKKCLVTYDKGWFDLFSDPPKIEVASLLYFIPVGSSEKRLLTGEWANEFMVTKVATNDIDDYTLLKPWIEMDYDFDTKDRPEWYHTLTTIPVK